MQTRHGRRREKKSFLQRKIEKWVGRLCVRSCWWRPLCVVRGPGVRVQLSCNAVGAGCSCAAGRCACCQHLRLGEHCSRSRLWSCHACGAWHRQPARVNTVNAMRMVWLCAPPHSTCSFSGLPLSGMSTNRSKGAMRSHPTSCTRCATRGGLGLNLPHPWQPSISDWKGMPLMYEPPARGTHLDDIHMMPVSHALLPRSHGRHGAAARPTHRTWFPPNHHHHHHHHYQQPHSPTYTSAPLDCTAGLWQDGVAVQAGDARDGDAGGGSHQSGRWVG